MLSKSVPGLQTIIKDIIEIFNLQGLLYAVNLKLFSVVTYTLTCLSLQKNSILGTVGIIRLLEQKEGRYYELPINKLLE